MYLGLSGLGTGAPPDCPVDSEDPDCLAAWQLYGSTTGGTSGGNCPGSPGCPGYVAPGSMDWQNSMLAALMAQGISLQQAQARLAAQPQPQVNKLDTTTMILLGGAALVLVVMMSGHRR